MKATKTKLEIKATKIAAKLESSDLDWSSDRDQARILSWWRELGDIERKIEEYNTWS